MEIRTVGDLIEDLKELDPSLKLVASSDDEGNSFTYVRYSPTEGKFDGENFTDKPNAEETTISELEEYDLKNDGDKVVCIN